MKKVKLPAIGLVVIGILSAVFALYGTIKGVDSNELMRGFTQGGVSEEQAQKITNAMSSGGRTLYIVGLVASIFVTWAGLQMLKLKSWTAAVIASILVMIPCVTWCCCLLGIPIGIWSLVVLFKSDVKSAFQGQGTPT